jgi:hypothetical protein
MRVGLPEGDEVAWCVLRRLNPWRPLLSLFAYRLSSSRVRRHARRGNWRRADFAGIAEFVRRGPRPARRATARALCVRLFIGSLAHERRVQTSRGAVRIYPTRTCRASLCLTHEAGAAQGIFDRFAEFASPWLHARNVLRTGRLIVPSARLTTLIHLISAPEWTTNRLFGSKFPARRSGRWVRVMRRRSGHPKKLCEHERLVALVRPRVEGARQGDEGDEKENAGSAVSVALHRHLEDMHGQSPFLWFARSAASGYKWKDAMRGPLDVCREFSGAPWAVVVTPQNVQCFALFVLEEHCQRTGATMLAYKRYDLIHRVKKALSRRDHATSAEEDVVVEQAFDDACKEVLVVFSHTTPDSSGPRKLYVSSRATAKLAYRASAYVTGGAERLTPRRWPVCAAGMDGSPLSKEQRGAAEGVAGALAKAGVCCLVGPGGCGKTHVLGALAGALEAGWTPRAAPGEDDRGDAAAAPYAFVAPTNKAAGVLFAKIGPHPSRIFGTIHSVARTLGASEDAHISLLVVDESSMLGDEHLELLLNCPAFARAAVVLAGDDLQLPPVSPGDVLRDLMRHAPVFALTANHRVGGSEQDTLAASLRRVRAGDMSGVRAHVQHDADPIGAAASWKPTLTVAVRHSERHSYNRRKARESPVSDPLLERYDDFRKAQAEEGALAPRSFVPTVGMPVVFTSNELKHLGACRGTTGTVSSCTVRRCVATVNVSLPGGEGDVQVTGTFWELHRYITVAYAVTVHSAQSVGSERVAVLLPPNANCPLLSLELLYTAVSRASREFRLFTTGESEWYAMIGKLNRRAPKRDTVLGILLDRCRVAVPEEQNALAAPRSPKRRRAEVDDEVEDRSEKEVCLSVPPPSSSAH